tara:strand:+ start:2014 stop:2514 length:501 start_codon:yes stop_codon:yes gene_type:complete
MIPQQASSSEEKTEAIIVLTGGIGRVSEGLTLLENGFGKKLFISGVYQGVDVKALLRLARRAPANLKCCIALGYAADNTRGNAIESANWIKSEKFLSVRIVTANYHMPRSLLEFRHVFPNNVHIIPHPVQPSGFSLKKWWKKSREIHLIISEYHKYILARLETELI